MTTTTQTGAATRRIEERKEILDRWRQEQKGIRLVLPDLVATTWVQDPARPGWEYSECCEWIGGRWEGYVATQTTTSSFKK